MHSWLQGFISSMNLQSHVGKDGQCHPWELQEIHQATAEEGTVCASAPRF